MNAKKSRALIGLGAGLALFVWSVFKVYNGGEWYWFVLLGGSYLAALHNAARLGWMDGDR